MIDELRHRDPLLFWIGALMVLALIVVTLLSIGDTRLILGLNPWVKPMKFLSSVTIFLWTVAWFMPETRPNKVLRNVVHLLAVRLRASNDSLRAFLAMSMF